MKIVADANIPFLEGVFEPYAEVVYKDGREIRREDCLDADVLIPDADALQCGAAGGDVGEDDLDRHHRH